jgi:hypothetical protein
MKLAAIYISQGLLPFIFGTDHDGQVLNLGGKFLYSFSENSSSIIIEKRRENEILP